MDCNGSYRNFVPCPNLAFSYHNYDPCPAVDMKHTLMGESSHGLVSMMAKNNYGNQEKKNKRLTCEQLKFLEESFQEEVKLDPDRKMKLSQELGLQPRQIAIWFQNRRARWKAKQLEHLYHALKQDFDVISREKQKLQQEVLKLRAILRDQADRGKLSKGCTMVLGNEAVESPLDGEQSSEKSRENQSEMAGCSYLFNIDEPPPYWCSLCAYRE